jgi:hypothetical protein
MASPWHDWWFWTLFAVVVLGVLVAVLYFTARGRSGDGGERTAEPAAGWEFAVLGFHDLTGAEIAYADVRGDGSAPWLHELAFVAMHHHGRARLRGTFAGHYVDVEDAASLPSSAKLVASIRGGVTDGASGLVSFAPPDTVEHLVGVFEGRATAVHRHTVSANEAASLAAAVAGTPAATA